MSSSKRKIEEVSKSTNSEPVIVPFNMFQYQVPVQPRPMLFRLPSMHTLPLSTGVDTLRQDREIAAIANTATFDLDEFFHNSLRHNVKLLLRPELEERANRMSLLESLDRDYARFEFDCLRYEERVLFYMDHSYNSIFTSIIYRIWPEKAEDVEHWFLRNKVRSLSQFAYFKSLIKDLINQKSTYDKLAMEIVKWVKSTVLKKLANANLYDSESDTGDSKVSVFPEEVYQQYLTIDTPIPKELKQVMEIRVIIEEIFTTHFRKNSLPLF